MLQADRSFWSSLIFFWSLLSSSRSRFLYVSLQFGLIKFAFDSCAFATSPARFLKIRTHLKKVVRRSSPLLSKLESAKIWIRNFPLWRFILFTHRSPATATSSESGLNSALFIAALKMSFISSSSTFVLRDINLIEECWTRVSTRLSGEIWIESTGPHWFGKHSTSKRNS